MSWEGIGGYLDKFKKITPPNKKIKATAINVIENLSTIKLKKEQIKINNNILFINTEPIIKNEVFIKKTDIIKKLNKSLPNTPIIDIR